LNSNTSPDKALPCPSYVHQTRSTGSFIVVGINVVAMRRLTFEAT
jgi:hypothetical protein